MPDHRDRLLRYLRMFVVVIFLALAYVFLDYSIDIRPNNIQSSYRFEIGLLVEDQPIFLRQDNLSILLIKRSAFLIDKLSSNRSGLQDPDSSKSKQPDYASNALRSREVRYFVSYAFGSEFRCPLELAGEYLLKEVCGGARYDFAGRALIGKNSFPNLAIPDYNFDDNFKILTIRP